MILPKVNVYELSSSEDGIVRYIGQTRKTLVKRRQAHITWVRRKLQDKSRRANWIRSILRRGYELQIKLLQADAVLHVTEMEWISHFSELGNDLVNGTLGGDGSIGVAKSAAHKAAIAAALRGRKSPWTAERNRQSKGKPGHPSTPETNAKISAAHKGRAKPYVAELNAERVWTDEARAKVGLANRKLTDDDIRQIKAQLSTGQTCTAMAKAYGVSVSLVARIRRNEIHQFIT